MICEERLREMELRGCRLQPARGSLFHFVSRANPKLHASKAQGFSQCLEQWWSGGNGTQMDNQLREHLCGLVRPCVAEILASGFSIVVHQDMITKVDDGTWGLLACKFHVHFVWKEKRKIALKESIYDFVMVEKRRVKESKEERCFDLANVSTTLSRAPGEGCGLRILHEIKQQAVSLKGNISPRELGEHSHGNASWPPFLVMGSWRKGPLIGPPPRSAFFFFFFFFNLFYTNWKWLLRSTVFIIYLQHCVGMYDPKGGWEREILPGYPPFIWRIEMRCTRGETARLSPSARLHVAPQKPWWCSCDGLEYDVGAMLTSTLAWAHQDSSSCSSHRSLAMPIYPTRIGQEYIAPKVYNVLISRDHINLGSCVGLSCTPLLPPSVPISIFSHSSLHSVAAAWRLWTRI